MNREEAIAIIRKEYLCVDRDCDIERNCGKCDLMMPSKEPILEAYKMAIKALEQEPCDVFDEYGNYKYPSDVELTEPNTATSMPCEDAISREDALMALTGEWTELTDEIIHRFIKRIKALPPVHSQPNKEDIHREREQAYMRGYEDGGRKYRTEQSEDAISRQEALGCCRNEWEEEVEMRLKSLPSVNPQPKTGHWIEHPEIETSTPEYLMFYECSECGDKQCFCKSDIHKKRFCSNCGAKMQESEEV